MASSFSDHLYLMSNYMQLYLYRLLYRFLSMNPDLTPRFTEFRGIIVTDVNRGNCHARIVMTAIENVVSALNDPEILASYMLEIGKRHATLNFKPSKSQVRMK